MPKNIVICCDGTANEFATDNTNVVKLKVDARKKADVLGGRRPFVAPDPNGYLHESLTGWWTLAEYMPKRHYNWQTRREERRANNFQRRTIPPRSVIHWSVYERAGNYAAKLDLPSDVVPLPKKERPRVNASSVPGTPP